MRLAFTDTGGSGPPVALLHGLLGSSRNWGKVAAALGASGRRVLALDLPNHGASPSLDPFGYEGMAAAVADTLEFEGAAPCDLVGHSMGGKAAMFLALTRPDVVRRLVVVDIAPVRYAHTFRPFIEAMLAAPVERAERRSEIDAHLAPSISDARVRAFLMQNLESRDGGYRWRADLAALARSMEAVMDFRPPPGARWDGPTLFLAGEDSGYVRPKHHAAIRTLFPHAEIRTIPGVGHWVHADAPRPFLTELTGFLTPPGGGRNG